MDSEKQMNNNNRESSPPLSPPPALEAALVITTLDLVLDKFAGLEELLCAPTASGGFFF